jgi:hypothetical protein
VVGDAGDVRVQRSLHIGPIEVDLRVVLDARIVASPHALQQLAQQMKERKGTIN